MQFQPQGLCHFYHLFYQSNPHLEPSDTISNLEQVFFWIFLYSQLLFTQKGQKTLWENGKETNFQDFTDHLVLLGKKYNLG